MVKKVYGRRLLVGLGAAALLCGAGVASAQDVELQGVLGEKALLTIDGERALMAVGEVSPQGVRLEQITPGWVEVTVGGESRRVELGSRVTRGYAQRAASAARVYPNPQGMYVAIGSINGFPLPMLLDTGATYVALDSVTAQRLGVNYRLRGEPTVVNTAAGQARAFEVRLDSVGLGEISLENVEAYVIEGRGPEIPLLGMSFLRRLEVSTEQGAMVLRQRH